MRVTIRNRGLERRSRNARMPTATKKKPPAESPPVEAPPAEVEALEPEAPAPEPVDPLDQQIADCHAAIAELRTSTAPEYVARPAKRADLISALQERISNIEAAKQARAEAAASRQLHEARLAAWAELQPQRVALAERWNALRSDLRALLADLNAATTEHARRCDRRLLSEQISAQNLSLASLAVLGESPILVQRDPL